MTELEVPFDALAAWDRHTYRAVKRASSEESGVRDIARSVCAAHLRRLVGDMELLADAARLRAEADRLDGGAS